jgi:superfamily II DNA/RNA helicase
MGFIGDIMEIVKKLPKSRQTLLFSATFPPKIQKLARELINSEKKEEIRIAISKPPEAIKQQVYFIDDRSKDALVAHLLRERTDLKRAIVFANRKTKVRELYRTLHRKGLNVAAVESGMDQDDREQVLRSFKNGTIQTVVATDVLSRGIDVKDIELVVNYDVPSDGEDYVHRIGRTARAETTGEAITLVSPRDKRDFQQIETLIEKKVERPELPDWLKSNQGGKSSDSIADRSSGRRRRSNPGNASSQSGDKPKSQGRRRNNQRPKRAKDQAKPTSE